MVYEIARAVATLHTFVPRDHIGMDPVSWSFHRSPVRSRVVADSRVELRTGHDSTRRACLLGRLGDGRHGYWQFGATPTTRS